MPPEDLMKYIDALTRDPSEGNILNVKSELSQFIDDPLELGSSIDLIAMAVEPVHPGITDRLRSVEDQIQDLREGWNFHNDIAIPLEHDARVLYGYPTKRLTDKIFSADQVENGYFAEAMMLLLRFKIDYAVRDDIDDFVKKCAPFIGHQASKIDKHTAAGLYAEFKELLGHDVEGLA